MTKQKSTSLDLSALDFLDKGKRRVYLEAVDQFRELGIGEDLSLPQVRSPSFGRLSVDH